MLRLCTSYFAASRNFRKITHTYRDISCTASYKSKRRSLVQTGQSSRKKEPGVKTILNDSQFLETSIPKIVQLRPVTSSTQTQASATCPSPPPTCPPTQPPSSSPQPPCPPPKADNNLRNLLLALLAGGTIIGGLYYIYGNEKQQDSLSSEKNRKESSKKAVIRKPANKEDFPRKVPYVLIGGGTASFAAFRAIKSREPDARVLVISAEDALPYMRPPLSKEIWYQKKLAESDKLVFRQWNGQERSIFYEPSEFYTDISELLTTAHGGVSVATGWVVSKVDPSTHLVELEDPKTNTKFEIGYDKCLIATGSRPKNLPIFEQASPVVKNKVVLYRSLRDLQNLWSTLENVKSVVIVGGGFLGSELACALAYRYRGKGPKIQQVFKESGNMGHVLPAYLAEWTTEKVRGEGVNVITGVEVKDVEMYNNDVVLTLSNESCVKADVIVVAVGSEPNVHLADSSSLEVHDSQGGYLVNAELEARTDLYVAGDAACFYDPTLGRRRVEHHDHAVVSGRLAGENMTGAAKAYKHQSMFWSDLGHDIGYEAIGIVDSCLPTVGVFAKGNPEKAADRLSSDGSQESGITNSETETAKAVLEKAAGDSESKVEKILKEKNSTMEKIENKSASNKQGDGELNPLPKKGITLECKDVTNKSCDNTDYNKGLIFYLKDDMVVGIVLWNVFNKMHIARQVLAEKRRYDDLNEVAKLFKIHEEQE